MPTRSAEAAERRRKRRRHADRVTFRDVIYLAGLAVIAASLWVAIRSDGHASQADRHATQAIAQQQQGRAVAITITCAVLSSVSEAGKAVIAGSPKPPPPGEESALEALGFPPFAARHARQEQSGVLYVQAISARVNRELTQLGHKPIPGLIRKDGTIDCRVLQRVGGVPNPQ